MAYSDRCIRSGGAGGPVPATGLPGQEGAQHAFNNDSNPARYHEEADRLAWKRTIAFPHARLG